MTNLLYVTSEILQKLKQHKAYYFWLPIVQNFPIRNVLLEERSFHPRNIEITNGYIYLTIDMKFAYARNNMFSFLYENQDLSYRFSAYQGILRTLDNKQFTALIGKIAKVTASTNVELVNTDKVYHPLFDSGAFIVETPSAPIELNNIDESQKQASPPPAQHDNSDEIIPKKRRGRPRKNPLPEDVSSPQKSPAPKGKRGRPKRKPAEISPETQTLNSGDNESILGCSKELCAEIFALKTKEKKNYDFLSQKFGLDKKVLRKICKIYRTQTEQVSSS